VVAAEAEVVVAADFVAVVVVVVEIAAVANGVAVVIAAIAVAGTNLQKFQKSGPAVRAAFFCAL
jgi:hypothetical protein